MDRGESNISDGICFVLGKISGEEHAREKARTLFSMEGSKAVR